MYADDAENNISYSNKPKKIVTDASSADYSQPVRTEQPTQAATPAPAAPYVEPDYYRNDVPFRPEEEGTLSSQRPTPGFGRTEQAAPNFGREEQSTSFSSRSERREKPRTEPRRAASIDIGDTARMVGFGGLEQSVSERRLDDYLQYNFATSFDLGRFLPKQLKLSAPIYYSYSKEQTTPKYNPLDKDMLLDDALSALSSDRDRDSLMNIAREVTTYRNFSLSNMRLDIQSKRPMPYDPANFSFSYAHSKRHNQGSTTAYENETDWQGSMSYNFAPVYKPWEPFKGIKSKSPWLKLLKEMDINWLPQSIAFNTDLSRHYYELQLRDMEALTAGASSGMPTGDGTEGIPVSFAKEFLWNRDFALRWDLTKNLQMNFTSATHAEIEEPYGVVNKELYPDEYTQWKDSVKRSLLSLGTPIDYQQTFNLNYKLPFSLLPATDVARLEEWGREIKRQFGAPLARTAGEGNRLTLKLPKRTTADCCIIQEDIAQGERIRAYRVEARIGGRWREVCRGTSVGHKRIARFDAPVTASAFRLVIEESRATPQVRTFSVHHTAAEER